MKNVFIFLIFIVSSNCYAQTTFRVCNVTSNTESLQTFNYKKSLNNFLAYKSENEPNQDIGNYSTIRIANDIQAYGKENANEIYMYSCHFHPFIETLHLSFAEHRPLIISPDMIWLMIIQGFAVHLDENSDDLREMFVKHDEKLKISIRRDDFRKDQNNRWDNTFPEFCDSIEKYVGSDITNLVVSNFSTTTFAEKASFQLALMDAVDNYFTYEVVTMCGIPEITLTGDTNDWQKILMNIDKFRKYDLDWWVDALTPVLQEFVDASKGDIDTSFWQSIYKMENKSGGPHVTGWILKMFPYLKDYQNNFNKNMNSEWGVTVPSFPSGYSKVDFIWDYIIADEIFEMEFIAGFVGIVQEQNGSLRTEINWAVREKK